MLLQFYSMQASPFSLALEVKVEFFELCAHDGQAPVRQAMLSGDSSCCLLICLTLLSLFTQQNNNFRTEVFCDFNFYDFINLKVFLQEQKLHSKIETWAILRSFG